MGWLHGVMAFCTSFSCSSLSPYLSHRCSLSLFSCSVLFLILALSLFCCCVWSPTAGTALGRQSNERECIDHQCIRRSRCLTRSECSPEARRNQLQLVWVTSDTFLRVLDNQGVDVQDVVQPSCSASVPVLLDQLRTLHRASRVLTEVGHCWTICRNH